MLSKGFLIGLIVIPAEIFVDVSASNCGTPKPSLIIGSTLLKVP